MNFLFVIFLLSCTVQSFAQVTEEPTAELDKRSPVIKSKAKKNTKATPEIPKAKGLCVVKRDGLGLYRRGGGCSRPVVEIEEPPVAPAQSSDTASMTSTKTQRPDESGGNAVTAPDMTWQQENRDYGNQRLMNDIRQHGRSRRSKPSATPSGLSDAQVSTIASLNQNGVPSEVGANVAGFLGNGHVAAFYEGATKGGRATKDKTILDQYDSDSESVDSYDRPPLNGPAPQLGEYSSKYPPLGNHPQVKIEGISDFMNTETQPGPYAKFENIN
jgi:hypothetical protein